MRLLIVSNRLPVSVKKENGKFIMEKKCRGPGLRVKRLPGVAGKRKRKDQ